jgi:hypothetical protein
MMRHILGVLGVLAALVLLVVSAMMNYQFGYNYGKTPVDGLIYGMASAAADCFKALTPFFFFAALRNRVWSQALAAVVVWIVVTLYAFMSALGHASTNRSFTNGERAAVTQNLQDISSDRKRLEDDLKSLEEKMSWIPRHRPPETVKAEIHVMEGDRPWVSTKGCTDITIKPSRDFCAQHGKLKAELGAGEDYQRHEVRRAEISARISELSTRSENLRKGNGVAVMGAADPQANLIARLTGQDIETIQTALMLFVALLIEIGSGFGLYVAFAYWRPNQSLHSIGETEPHPPRTGEAKPARKEEKAEASEERKDATQPAARAADPIWTADPATASADAGPPAVRFGDNDNQTGVKPAIMPPSDVERFYQEDVDSAGEGAWVASMRLNEAYKLWCKRNKRTALPMPNFTAEFDKLKVVKAEIGGGVKYFGIALKPDIERELEQKGSRKRKPVLGSGGQGGAQEKSAAEAGPTPYEATGGADKLRAAAAEMREHLEPQAKTRAA